MEFTGNLSGVPPQKDGKRKPWSLPKGVTLREGQRQCLDYVLANPKQASYLFELPTGYGKTYVAALLIQSLRDQGRANRFVVVVPNVALQEQMVDDQALAKACNRLGVKIAGSIMSASDSMAMHRLKAKRNAPEVLVTTIQGLSSTSGSGGQGGVSAQTVREFCKGGLTGWICDEAHHYGTDNTWGQSISDCNPEVIAGLSATPVRGDKKATIFGQRKADVVVTVEAAVAEKAIRPTLRTAAYYNIDVMKDGEIETLSASQIASTLIERNLSISEWEIKHDIRYLSKYISPVISEPFMSLRNLNSCLGDAGPKTCHQMIIYCMSFKHAKAVAEVVNAHARAFFHSSDKPFAEIISDGVDESGGVKSLSSSHNAEVMEAFNDPNPLTCLKCVICVNKLSEGYDNPRVSHVVFLDLVGPHTPDHIQKKGRTLRWDYRMPDEHNVARVYAGEDHPMWSVPSEGDDEERDRPGGDEKEKDSEPKWIEIKDAERWRVSDVLHTGYSREEAFQMYAGVTEEDYVEMIMSDEKAVGVLSSLDIPTNTPEQIGDYLLSLLEKRHKAEVAQISDKTLREIWRKWNEEAVSIFAGNIYRNTCRGAAEKSQAGDTYKMVNSQLKAYFGVPVSQMEVEDLRRRYELIQMFNNEVRGFPEKVVDRSNM